MSDHIKSNDLCARCRFEFFRHCEGKMRGNCFGCVMNYFENTSECKCLTIKENTPCPYFVEDTEK